MHIFVINLDKDISRLAHVRNQFASLGLVFERIPGVLGPALTPDEKARDYDDGRAKWHHARSLTDAEIGCALSHISVYRRIVLYKIPMALVLEDDVILPTELPSILSQIAQVLAAGEPTVCLLSEAAVKDEVRALLDSRHRLAAYRAGYYTSSYVITNAASENLAEALYPVSYLADAWPDFVRSRLVNVLAAVPPIIRQDQERFGSSTTAAIKSHFFESRMALLAYKLRRIRNILWDAVRQRRSPKRSVSRELP